MKRILLTATIAVAIAGGGLALAQMNNQSESAGSSRQSPGMMGGGSGPGMMGSGYGPGGGNGPGMMGGGYGPGMGGYGMMGMMGGGMFQMMGNASTKIEVKKIAKGVTITMTSPDATTAARLQKMAEAMQLMHEAVER